MLARKVVIMGGGILILSVFMLYTAFYFLTYSSFESVSINHALQEAEFVDRIISHRIDVIDNFCADWAEWDDTYEFILKRSKAYIYSNLLDETFSTLDVNFIVYLNREGEAVAARGFDLENETTIYVPHPLMEKFRELAAKNDEDVKKGLFRVGDKIYVFSARPVLRSDESGPYVGTQIFARVVDESFVGELSETFGTNFALSTIERDVEVKKLDESHFLVFYPLKDYNGEVIGSIEFPFESEAMKIFSALYVPLAVAGISVSGAIIMAYILFIREAVVQRIEKLAETLRKITEGGWRGRVEVEGNDEITNLQINVNELLEEVWRKIAEIEELNENLRLVNKLMRHDILNDLTSISLTLEILKDQDCDEKFVQNIEKSVNRIVDLIKRVRTLEEALKSEIKLHEVDLREVIEEIAEKYGVEMELEGETRVLADENVYSVFENLVSNAVKHGGANKIFVSGISEDGHCKITFSDNGKGIPEILASRIFEEGLSTKGSGLGLYIVRKLMERYGGDISLVAAKPATFMLRFRK